MKSISSLKPQSDDWSMENEENLKALIAEEKALKGEPEIRMIFYVLY